MMNDKRIGFFVTSTSWNNFQRWHYQVSIALENRGYEVVVITPSKSRLYAKIKQKGNVVIPFKRSRFLLVNLFRLVGLLKRYQIKTLFINYQKDVPIAGFAKKLAKISKLLYRRGTTSGIKSGWINRFVFNAYIDEIITNSQANKDSMLARKPDTIKNTPIKVVYQGLQVDHFDRPLKESDKERADNRIIIGMSNCNYDNSYCFDLLKTLQNRIDTSSFRFVVYQNSDHSRLYQKLRKLKLNEMVTRDVKASNLKEFMENIDIYMSPVASNSFNYSLLYAMIYRKPVIGIKKGSNEEVIEDSKNGYLLEENNFEKLEKAFESLKDKETRHQFGLEAEKMVREKFNFEKSMDQIEEII